MTTKPTKQKSFRELSKETAERMGETAPDVLACRYCGTATSRDVLSSLGARCSACFAQFQRMGYSGQVAPRQAKQCPEVRADAARIRAWREEQRAAGGTVPNSFGMLADRLKVRQAQLEAGREALQGLDDDQVNALLQVES